MNDRAIAERVARSVVLADCEKCADLIDDFARIMPEFTKLSEETHKAFLDCQNQLKGLQRAGVGVTEADTLLETIVLPRAKKMQSYANTLCLTIERALRG